MLCQFFYQLNRIDNIYEMGVLFFLVTISHTGDCTANNSTSNITRKCPSFWPLEVQKNRIGLSSFSSTGCNVRVRVFSTENFKTFTDQAITTNNQEGVVA